uniref:Uncharacterized protein n=1 Tax=Mycena chlorophos TaxID=658473 RepID=A0ABQ0L2X5_MYCCL|nr:predicted protein [Mycena chlorophos]
MCLRHQPLLAPDFHVEISLATSTSGTPPMPSGTHRTVYLSRDSQARNSENERRHVLEGADGLGWARGGGVESAVLETIGRVRSMVPAHQHLVGHNNTPARRSFEPREAPVNVTTRPRSRNDADIPQELCAGDDATHTSHAMRYQTAISSTRAHVRTRTTLPCSSNQASRERGLSPTRLAHQLTAPPSADAC